MGGIHEKLTAVSLFDPSSTTAAHSLCGTGGGVRFDASFFISSLSVLLCVSVDYPI